NFTRLRFRDTSASFAALMLLPRKFASSVAICFFRDVSLYLLVADPTKVRVEEREHAEEETRLLDSIVGYVVSLLPIAPARAESELEASVERLFDEGGSADQKDFAASGGQDDDTGLVTGVKIVIAEDVVTEKPKRPRKKKQDVTNASGSSHPPKKLRGDYGTSCEVATSGKSPSALRELLVSSMLNVEAGVAAVATMPMVTSSVFATSEHESGAPADSITRANLRTIGASERFIISLDSSHHSDTNDSGAEDDSIIRFVVVPSVMTEAVVTSHVVTILSVLKTGAKFTSSVYASLFQDSDSTEMMKADAAGPSYSTRQDLSIASRKLDPETLHQVFVQQWNVLNDSLLDDYDVSEEFVDHLAPLALFSQIHEMDYRHLFMEFNVGTAHQACLNAKVRCGPSTVLESLDGKVVELQSLISTKDLELKDLNVAVSSLRSQKDGLVDHMHALETTCSGLHEQVFGYEHLKEWIEEFQDAQMKIVDDKVAKLDADLLEMACHLEEKFYPHLLTTISGWRWLLTHGLKLVLVKCLNSSEYLTALGAAISRAIEQGMQSGLAARIDHGKEGKSLTDVAAYNPNTKADFNTALQKIREVDFPLHAELESHKDASVEDIMNLLRLEGPFADAPGMIDFQPDIEQLRIPIHRSEDQVVLGETSLSFALIVSHSCVKQIRANITAERSAVMGVWTPLFEPLSV
nr:hypothetical protein [Tanacetum cinerariifolium]